MGLAKARRSLTSLIWKEKRRRRRPGGSYFSVAAIDADRMRSLEDTTMTMAIGGQPSVVMVFGNSSIDYADERRSSLPKGWAEFSQNVNST